MKADSDLRHRTSQKKEQVRKRGLPPLIDGLRRRGQAPLPDLFFLLAYCFFLTCSFYLLTLSSDCSLHCEIDFDFETGDGVGMCAVEDEEVSVGNSERFGEQVALTILALQRS